jgi:hypothetical protein
MGVDVARFGGDLTAIYVVRGGEIIYSERYGKMDTVFTADRVMRVAEDHGLGKTAAHRIAIDDTGVGGGVTDILRANGWAVRGEDFGAAASDPERFLNRRTEMWWGLREWLRDVATLEALSPDDRRRIEAEAVGVTYRVEARGARTVTILERKSDTKKRLGHSPDNTDALVLALAHLSAKESLWTPEALQRVAGQRREDPASSVQDAMRDADAREDRENARRHRGKAADEGVGGFYGD